MAEGKKSFILYADYMNTIEELTDDEAGKLVKHLFRYVNDLNPEQTDRIVKLAFEPIKLQLKRDLKDWEQKKQKRSEAGKVGGVKSGEQRKQNEAKPTIASILKQNERLPTIANDCQANEAVTVNVTVTDTVLLHNSVFPTFPTENDLPLELPEIKIGAVKELMQIGKQVNVDEKKVLGYWNVFKVQNFTGKKFYQDKSDVFTHFINWMNKQTVTTLKTYSSYSATEEISDTEKKEKLKQQLSKYD